MIGDFLSRAGAGFEKLGKYIAAGYEDLTPGGRALSIAWLGASTLALVGSSYYLYGNSQQIWKEECFTKMWINFQHTISTEAIKGTAVAAMGAVLATAALGAELIGLGKHGKDADDSRGGSIEMDVNFKHFSPSGGSPSFKSSETGMVDQKNEQFLKGLRGVKLFEKPKK